MEIYQLDDNTYIEKIANEVRIAELIGEEEEEEPLFKTWLLHEDGSVQASKAVKQVSSVKAGIWEVVVAQGNYILTPSLISNKTLMQLPNVDIGVVTKELRQFWEMGEEFKELDMVHKRGVLLWGPPGTGKSSLVRIIANICVKEFNGLVFYISTKNDLHALINFASYELDQLEKGRNLVVVFEDIDELYRQCPADLTAFLDGEDELEHCVVLATTNHIEELDEILTRHSRFDQIIEVAEPDDVDRRAYLVEKFKFEEGEELEKWVKATDKMSIATITEFYKLVKLFKNDFDESVKRIKNHNTLVSKKLTRSTKKDTSVGFGFGK